MKRVKIASLALGVMALSALASFTVVSALNGPSAQAMDSEEAAPRVQDVDSLDEAGHIAGYDVLTPSFIPEGYELHRISVVRKPPGSVLPPAVQQFWIHKDDPGVFILLEQHQGLNNMNLAAGETTDIDGTSAQKATYRDGETGKRFYMDLLWREGEAGFLLMGTLEGTTTEETLKQVAASVS